MERIMQVCKVKGTCQQNVAYKHVRERETEMVWHGGGVCVRARARGVRAKSQGHWEYHTITTIKGARGKGITTSKYLINSPLTNSNKAKHTQYNNNNG